MMMHFNNPKDNDLIEHKKVVLYAPNDLHYGYLSPDGAFWDRFETDYLAMEESDDCAICEKEIESGYLCLDGGDTVCADHVEIVPEWIGDKLHSEFMESVEHKNALVGMRCIVGEGVCKSFRATHRFGYLLGWVIAE